MAACVRPPCPGLWQSRGQGHWQPQVLPGPTCPGEPCPARACVRERAREHVCTGRPSPGTRSIQLQRTSRVRAGLGHQPGLWLRLAGSRGVWQTPLPAAPSLPSTERRGEERRGALLAAPRAVPRPLAREGRLCAGLRAHCAAQPQALFPSQAEGRLCTLLAVGSRAACSPGNALWTSPACWRTLAQHRRQELLGGAGLSWAPASSAFSLRAGSGGGRGSQACGSMRGLRQSAAPWRSQHQPPAWPALVAGAGQELRAWAGLVPAGVCRQRLLPCPPHAGVLHSSTRSSSDAPSVAKWAVERGPRSPGVRRH